MPHGRCWRGGEKSGGTRRRTSGRGSHNGFLRAPVRPRCVFPAPYTTVCAVSILHCAVQIIPNTAQQMHHMLCVFHCAPYTTVCAVSLLHCAVQIIPNTAQQMHHMLNGFTVQPLLQMLRWVFYKWPTMHRGTVMQERGDLKKARFTGPKRFCGTAKSFEGGAASEPGAGARLYDAACLGPPA